MERLTELKAGTLLPIEVLNAWAAAGDNVYYCKWERCTNVFNIVGDTEITRVSSNSNSFYTRDKGLDGRYNFVSTGFINFYNKFYNLDNQPMDNFVITPIKDSIQRKAVEDKLVELGILGKSRSSAGHTYFRKNGVESSWGDGSYWQHKQPNATVISPEEFLGSAQPTKSVRTNFDNCQVVCNTIEEIAQVVDKVIALGYPVYPNFKVNMLRYNNLRLYIISKCNKIEHDNPVNQSYPHQTLITVADILGKQLTNTNNTPLNTKTDGNKIIVCKPVKTITGGQRPEGTSISGKTRPTTIGVGHLSHRAINS